jgi:ribonuclease HII
MNLFYFNHTELNNIIECGIDEAGRGPLIGNVYAAAVIWPIGVKPDETLIKDSKKLSPKKRQQALEWIKKNITYYGIGFATNQEIDNINILEATKLAMNRAINNLQIKPTHYIIDGIGWEKKFNNLQNIKSIVKGDNYYYSIAAASILAKVYHDKHIIELCQINSTLNEKYKLESNMGYASKKHIEGIKNYGYTDYHRKSFKLKNINKN